MKYLGISGILADNRILGLPSTVQEWETDKRNWNLNGSVLRKAMHFRKRHEIVSTPVQKKCFAILPSQGRSHMSTSLLNSDS